MSTYRSAVKRGYRRASSVDQLIAQVATAIALPAGVLQMFWDELNANADRVTAYLRMLSAGAERLIGNWLLRSFDQKVAYPAVLKSVSLGPVWGQERVLHEQST